jgi:hypothetical protein
MAFHRGPKLVTNGLVLYVDAANTKSYISGSTTWSNLATTSNSGTLTNGPTFNSANGGSIVLDGTNDYVEIANSTSLQLSTGMSVCCWVNIANSNELGDILNKQTYNNALDNSGFILRYYNGSFGVFGRLDFVILNNSYNVVSTSADVVLLNNWYYLCGVYNGSQMIIYVNGVSSGTTNYSSNARTNNVSLLIGGYSFGGYSIGGNVSTVQIYNRGLADIEVLQNYNATKSRFGL